METVNKLEERLAEWYKQVPHLPQGVQKWLVENVWWIVLITVIISSIGVLSLVTITLFGGVFLAGAVFLFSAKFGGLALLLATAAIGIAIVDVVLAAMSISPLKNRQKKGWTLLFIALLLSLVSMVLIDLLRFNIFNVIEDVLMVAVGGYFLFEIRHQYGFAPATSTKKATPVFVAPSAKKK